MDKKEIKNTDTFTLGGKEFTSRFILGSGKFSLDLVKCRRSGTYCQTFQRSRMWQFRQSGSGKRFEISPSG